MSRERTVKPYLKIYNGHSLMVRKIGITTLVSGNNAPKRDPLQSLEMLHSTEIYKAHFWKLELNVYKVTCDIFVSILFLFSRL